MLRGLSKAGLGAVESNKQLIELAARYHFQSVDLDPSDFIAEVGLDEAKSLLAKHNIVIGSMGLNVEWRNTEEEFRVSLQKLAADAAAAAALGCRRCCTYIIPSTDSNPAHFMAIAIRRLKTCAQIVGSYGIALGLEYVGAHHLRSTWANPFIWTQQQTLDMIAAINEPNVGLLYDAFHWYTNELTLQDITALRADQIIHVHINDVPNLSVADIMDNGRLYPGEGIINLAGFLRALHQIGYDGSITQEILTAQPPTESPEVLAQRSKAAFDQVFSAAGL